MTSPARDEALGRVLEGVVAARRLLGDARRRRPFAAVTLTSSQLEALFVVSHSTAPVTPGALAARLGLTAGAVTQLVDGLKRAGLVAQFPHPDDARSRVIRLSDTARREVDAFEAEVVADMRRHVTRLTDDELVHLGRLLAKMGDDDE
jgi:DNA-binding MarR family transcriptional regulator